MTGVRLYVLDGGVIDMQDYAMFSPSAGPREPYVMTVRSYVVAHPRGTLVWDTGLGDAIHAENGGREIVEGVIWFKVTTTLRAQLDAIDVDPGDVRYLALSHLHPDHVGNVDLFGHATVLVQKAELDAAFSPEAEALTYFPDAYASLDRDRVRAVRGEHDVFGDGSVVFTPLPGHTPGHMGVLVRLAETGAVLLAGDVSYSVKDYAAGLVRGADVDVAASARSLATVKELEAEGVTVWLHHDTASQRDVRTAPGFYA
jgi:glyoxylase-like metal-dependent hydrolase (beta-lactamase superfamily II)